jgi:hypothetical protein
MPISVGRRLGLRRFGVVRRTKPPLSRWTRHGANESPRPLRFPAPLAELAALSKSHEMGRVEVDLWL